VSDDGSAGGELWDAPNQQAVRPDSSAPWEEGTGGADIEVSDDAFDPSTATVAEVEDYVTEFPEERLAVLAAERSGKNRTTLINWLETA
jgi:hypothetical protein